MPNTVIVNQFVTHFRNIVTQYGDEKFSKVALLLTFLLAYKIGAACVTRTHDPRILANYNFRCHPKWDVCGLDFLFTLASEALGGSCKVSTLASNEASTGLPTALPV